MEMINDTNKNLYGSMLQWYSTPAIDLKGISLHPKSDFHSSLITSQKNSIASVNVRFIKPRLFISTVAN